MKSLELLTTSFWWRLRVLLFTRNIFKVALFQIFFQNILSSQVFGGDFVWCSFPRNIFRMFFHHKLLVETPCAALSPVVCLFLLSVGLVPVDRQRHKRGSFFSLDNMSLVALLQPITRANCSNKGNLEKVPGGNYQGTLWTLLVSWFFDRHHKDGLRLKLRNELKEMHFRKNNWH